MKWSSLGAGVLRGRLAGARAAGEAGQTTLLIVGFAVMLMMAVAVVVNASAAYLQRQGLATIADGAALAGADGGAQGTEVYADGLQGEQAAVTAEAARVAVARYLDAVDARASYPGLRATVGVVNDRVTVDIRAPLDLPLRFPGAPRRASVHATGAAIIVLTR